MKQKKIKIAILHEMLIKLWWAEKVVEKLLNIFPEADLYTLIYDQNKVWQVFPKSKINKQVFSLTTQKIYNLTKNQRLCLIYMPGSVESLDFSKYDVVLASSSAFAHWSITKPETKLIVYYHSPARYMWDRTNEYKRDIWWNKWIKWYILNKILLKLRQWDYIASKRVDISLANSKNVQERIKKYYKKNSTIIYPPVETDRFRIWVSEDYYIIISALSEFKKIEVAIEWFNKMNNKKLKIVGWWTYEWYLKKLAWDNKNIEFLWPKYGDELVELLSKCKWYIFPGEEDFGITPVEAMASGKWVFAYRGWGLLETMIEWETWEFFDDNNWSDFIDKFQIFEKNIDSWVYDSEKIRWNAIRFSEQEFEKKIKEIITKSII